MPIPPKSNKSGLCGIFHRMKKRSKQDESVSKE
jgi:hypothetical protein